MQLIEIYKTNRNIYSSRPSGANLIECVYPVKGCYVDEE